MGSVVKPVNSPGCCSEKQVEAPLWSLKAVSLSQQVMVHNPGVEVGVVTEYQE